MSFIRFLMLAILLVASGCSRCKLDSSDFKDSVPYLNIIKSEFQESSKIISDSLHSIDDFKLAFPQVSDEIDQLGRDYGLCSIKYYNNTGLEFKFNYQSSDTCEYYILTTFNPNNKKDFLGYEQYVEYLSEKVEYDSNWTFIKTRYYKN